MYIVLVFIGVVSLRYDNTAEWFLMAKLKPAKKDSLQWFHDFFEAVLSISVSDF